VDTSVDVNCKCKSEYNNNGIKL